MARDALGKRMKCFYEEVPKTRLLRKTPVALRIDGKAFHTFTRGFAKPYDAVMVRAMQQTMLKLCENIQGCVLGYTQSDEITLILVDYRQVDSEAWFDYEVQKLCSISASMATVYFNQSMARIINDLPELKKELTPPYSMSITDEATYRSALLKGAVFDSRCFNIPKDEVTNLIYWRQCDATRNSIQMVAQANFSHGELQGKSCNLLQDMLLTQRDINWNNYPIFLKRGTACLKQIALIDTTDKKTGRKKEMQRAKWILDEAMPILKDEGRLYVETLVNFSADD